MANTIQALRVELHELANRLATRKLTPTEDDALVVVRVNGQFRFGGWMSYEAGTRMTMSRREGAFRGDAFGTFRFSVPDSPICDVLGRAIEWLEGRGHKIRGGGEAAELRALGDALLEESRRRGRTPVVTVKTCNPKAARILKDNPSMTIRELAEELHCSIGLVAKLPAWQYTQRQLGFGPKLPAHPYTPKVDARQGLRKEAELKRLTREQEGDGKSDGSIEPFKKRGNSHFRPRRTA